MYLFSNSIGSFILDENGTCIEEMLTTTTHPQAKDALTNTLQRKYKNIQPLPQNKLPLALTLMRDKKYLAALRDANRDLTNDALRHSVGPDNLMTQTVSAIEEIDKVTNLLTKRLREWYGLTLPELGELVTDHAHLATLIAQHSRNELQTLKKIDQTIGTPFIETDLTPIRQLAAQINSLYILRQEYENYLKTIMKTHCPNMLELAGATIGAKLLVMAKGLKNLALLPSSTIQLLGAEKALFRHIATGARSPKYGIIINHPYVQNSPKQNKGKAARLLADKLSLCARLDYFKGEFKAPSYKKELDEKSEKEKTQKQSHE